jgi:hypothetical protein
MIRIYGKLPEHYYGCCRVLRSALASKICKAKNWKDSLTIGALMNTRGLMELIVLNIRA